MASLRETSSVSQAQPPCRCQSRAEEMMSTLERQLWNFEEGACAAPVPGNALVNKGACRFLRSDP